QGPAGIDWGEAYHHYQPGFCSRILCHRRVDNRDRHSGCFRRGPSWAWDLKQPSRKQTMTGGVLVFLLILGAYVVGFVGWGSPKPQSSGSAVLVYNSESTVTSCGSSMDNVKVYNLTTNSYSQILTESFVSIKDNSAL